ncbi:MAG: prephenate dehydrogenase [Syntrophomonadaceae bacterium]|nr:prephenate dehydrogenase [Syntrophomonadaceae bacterium]
MAANVFIIGLGLIGGSLGLALRGTPSVKTVNGFDTEPQTLQQALQIGAIDAGVTLTAGVAEADVIIICVPLRFYASIIEEIKPHLKPGCIVTDVGSTKQPVMQLFKHMPENIYCVGGHPMAGAEIKGINGADRYLFENAVYVLTPEDNVPRQQLDFLSDLLSATGARIRIMPALLHDQLVATVSHIPHLSAVALVHLTDGREEDLMMAAGGFRDTTRIASSTPELWEDIIFSNRDILLDKLDEFIAQLAEIKSALQAGDIQAMHEKLSRAKAIRDLIPRVRRGLMPGFSDLICIVPDQPGIIGSLGSILNQHKINIVDIEILRAREGDGGTIRLGVPSPEDAEQAVQALLAQNIKAWVK